MQSLQSYPLKARVLLMQLHSLEVRSQLSVLTFKLVIGMMFLKDALYKGQQTFVQQLRVQTLLLVQVHVKLTHIPKLKQILTMVETDVL